MEYESDISDIIPYCRTLLQDLLVLHTNSEHDKIKEILEIDINIKKVDTEIVSRYYINKGMIFLKNNDICVTPRIYVDNNIKEILDILYLVIDDIISENQLIDMIINRWSAKYSKNIASLRKTQIHNQDTENLRNYIKIKVSERTWNGFKKICTIGNIFVRDAFRIAVVEFLENTIKEKNNI